MGTGLERTVESVDCRVLHVLAEEEGSLHEGEVWEDESLRDFYAVASRKIISDFSSKEGDRD